MKLLFLGNGFSLNGYFLLTSLFLSLLNQLNKERSLLILSIISIMVLIPFAIQKVLPFKSDHRAGLLFVSLAALICSTNFLFFENDHFRYLFDCSLLVSGESPYQICPSHSDILYKFKYFIGYPHLCSPYPFLALIYFGLISLSVNSLGFLVLCLIHAIAIWWLTNRVIVDSPSFNRKGVGLSYLCFFLLKEYCYSLHFDILGFCIFYSAVFAFERKSYLKAAAFLFISTGLKLFGLFGAFILFCCTKKKVSKGLILISCFQLIALIVLYQTGFFNSSGWTTFSRQWWFGSGMGSILVLGGLSSTLYNKAWLFLLGLYSLFFLRWRKQPILEKSFFFFAGLLFLSPVYNSWYTIWFFVPAFFVRNEYYRLIGIAYGVFSALSTALFLDFSNESEWRVVISCFTHFPFLLLVLFSLIYLVTNRNPSTS
jgi:hypothetical protein